MKFKLIFALILVVFSISMVGCAFMTDPDIDDVKCDAHVDLNNDYICDNCTAELEKEIETSDINVMVNTEKITIKDVDISNFNFKDLFVITKDGSGVSVLDSYLDLSQLSESAGIYEVVCTYEGHSAKIVVEVIETIYELSLSVDEITVNQLLVDEYDFLALFTAKIDGVTIEITDDMITSNVIAEVGRYEFTVTNNKISKTLIVNVTNINKIEIINTYNDVEIYYNELPTFDFTTLFAVYVNEIAIEVTNDMIDISALADAVIGESYIITLTCTTNNNDLSKSIEVKIVEPKELLLTAKNLVIYPNAEYIDLCSLFEIKYGDESIPVTSDMITGNINYTVVGVNEISLSYNGETVISTVEVKKGVVINPRYSDTITILKGTNQTAYSFANDFMVVVNGV